VRGLLIRLIVSLVDCILIYIRTVPSLHEDPKLGARGDKQYGIRNVFKRHVVKINRSNVYIIRQIS